MPELHFYRDDSLDYAQEIDNLLKWKSYINSYWTLFLGHF
jgi:hypothetical protein